MRMNASVQRWGLVLARVAIAVIFMHSGIGKIQHWQMTAGFMASKGMPIVPFFLLGAIFLELGGSLLLVTGIAPRIGAAMLLLMLIPTTLIFHQFWADPTQLPHFLSNLAIIGGLGVLALTDRRAGSLGAQAGKT